MPLLIRHRGFPRRNRLPAAAVIALCCAFAATPRAARAEDEARRTHMTLLTEALQKFDEAAALPRAQQRDAAELYRQAAAKFEELLAAGVRNGPLYYNLGNTYLRLGDTGRAILNYRRAQQYMPRDGRLEANLRFARSQRLNKIEPPARSRLIENLLFWHYGTSLSARLRAGVALFLLAWLLLLVRIYRPGGLLVPGFLLSLGLSLALGASVAVQLYQREHSPPGVILAPDVVARMGNGFSYSPQFEERLQPGAEFTLLERRAGWLRIRLPDEQEGWIPAETAETL